MIGLMQFEKRVQEARELEGNLTTKYMDARQALLDYWRYDYKAETDILSKPPKLWKPLSDALKPPLPDVAQMQKDRTAISGDVIALAHKFEAAERAFPGPAKNWNDSFKKWQEELKTEQGPIRQMDRDVLSLLGDLAYFQAAQKLLQQAYTALVTIMSEDGEYLASHANEQALPIGPYAQKQAPVSITCKDIATDKQVFDAIQFTAYFQKFPKWDFSAGALASTLGGRQVGVVSGPLLPAGNPQCPSAPSTAPSGTPNPPCSLPTLAVTSSSKLQFMPMAFADFHPVNKKCRWATEGMHPSGYVCSFGFVFGFTANPNNGGATPEFFEGVSFGVQRVALVVGFHNGRYQDFGEGYEVDQTVPSGVTPPTVRYWRTRFAFGITYRIPIH